MKKLSKYLFCFLVIIIYRRFKFLIFNDFNRYTRIITFKHSVINKLLKAKNIGIDRLDTYFT